MKFQLPKLILAIAALATTGLQAEDKVADATAAQTKTFNVTGMMCTSCESKVKNAVSKVDGVKKVDANSDKGTAVVSYDPAKTTEEKITAAINATDFKVAK